MLENVSQAVAISYSSRPQPQTEEDARLARRAHRTRQKLIDLIRAGDADGAEDLWRRHLIEAGKVLAAGTGERLVDLFG
jgi:DNA-binding GntR family transcriptional regulator